MEKSLQSNSSLYGDQLDISIENLDELYKLIEDVKEMENALHEAVRKLETYKLSVSFVNK